LVALPAAHVAREAAWQAACQTLGSDHAEHARLSYIGLNKEHKKVGERLRARALPRRQRVNGV
jgi:hypothetical protein